MAAASLPAEFWYPGTKTPSLQFYQPNVQCLHVFPRYLSELDWEFRVSQEPLGYAHTNGADDYKG